MKRGHLEVKTLSSPEEILSWVQGGSKPTSNVDSLKLLVGYLKDGVVWGKYEDSTWKLSCDSFSQVSPEFKQNKLLELRLFGPKAEIMIWFSNDVIHGRIAADTRQVTELESQPYLDQWYLLLGSRIDEISNDGFALFSSGTGSRQAMPVRAEHQIGQLEERHPCILVRYYFKADNETGEISCQLTRFVDVDFRGVVHG